MQLAESYFLGGKGKKRTYEGITYNDHDGIFYMVVESKKTNSGSYYPWVHEYDEAFKFLRKERLDFKIFRQKKGFEGMAYVYRHGISYLLAVCEGNQCKGKDDPRLKDPGYGRIKVFEKVRD